MQEECKMSMSSKMVSVILFTLFITPISVILFAAEDSRVSSKGNIVQAGIKCEKNKILFLDEKGNLTREIDFTNNSSAKVGVSINRKRVAVTSNLHRKYSDEERENIWQKMQKEGRQGRKATSPKDLWGVLQNIDIYDDAGSKLHSIHVDIMINHVYCTDKGEVVANGMTVADSEGSRGSWKLLFFDRKGSMVKSIDNKEAKEQGITTGGYGKIYNENKIIWVGSAEVVVVFDLKGNVLWKYEDKHMSSMLEGDISYNKEKIYIKAWYLDNKKPGVEKTWVIDKNGKFIEMLDGWGNKVE